MTKHSAERRERVAAALQEAMEGQRCLAVTTATGEGLTGYCVGVGRRWAIVHQAAPWPDGWVAVRLAELERLDDAPKSALARRAFEHEGAWPPVAPDGVGLDETADLVVSLAERHRLLGVVLRGDEDGRFVGAPAMVAEGTLMVHELGDDLSWGALSAWRLRDLAEVSVGDRYLTLLGEIAPARPAQPSPFAD